MRNLKESTLIKVILILLFSQAVYADPIPEILPLEVVEAANEANSRIGQIGSDAENVITEESENQTASKVLEVYSAIGVEAAVVRSGNAAQSLTSDLNAIVLGNDMASLTKAYSELDAFANSKCGGFSQKSATCCQNPDSCKAAGMDLGAITEGIGVLGSLLGGGGAASQCLGVLPQITEALTGSNSTSKMCKLLRDGGSVTFKDAEQAVQIVGCVDLCQAVGTRISEVQSRAAALVGAANPTAASLAQSAGTLAKSVQEMGTSCGQTLADGESKANTQSSSLQTALQGAMSCAQALVNGDETDEDVASTMDCSDIAYANSNPTLCRGYGSGDLVSDDVLSKTSGLDLTTTSGLSEEDDDEAAILGKTNSDGDSSNSGVGGQAKTSAASLGGGGLGGGSQEKTGKRGRAKGKDLIAGYKASKGGGSSSGSRAPAFKSKFKSKFKKLKNKNKNKNALAALSKLIKAGVSPDQTESIFKRVSNRFTASIRKEKMFDCKRNKKLWMEK